MLHLVYKSCTVITEEEKYKCPILVLHSEHICNPHTNKSHDKENARLSIIFPTA